MKHKLLLFLFTFVFYAQGFSQAEIIVQNTNNQTTYIPGYTSVYTVTVSNDGPDSTTNLTVINEIPYGVTSFSWEGSNGSSGIGINLNDTIPFLNSGEQVVYTITLEVPSTQNLPFTSEVFIQTADDNVVLNCDECIDTDVMAQAAVVGIKQPQTINNSFTTNLVYMIQVGNNGTDVVEGVLIDVQIAADYDITQVNWVGSNGTSGSGNIQETIASLQPGEVVYYQLSAVDDGGYTDMGINVIESVNVSASTPTANLVHLVSSGSYVPGNQLVYVLSLKNNNNNNFIQPGAAINNVTAQLNFPALFDQALISWTSSTGLSGTGNLNAVIASIPAQELVNFYITTPMPVNFVPGVTVPTMNIIGGNASLQSTLTPAVVPQNLVYTIQVQNDGPDLAYNVVVEDIIPAIPGVDVSQVQWTSDYGASGTGNLYHSIPTLDVGEIVTYTVTIPAIPSGFSDNILNSVTITSDTPNPNQVCLTCNSIASPTQSADLLVQKNNNISHYVVENDVVYQIHITNQGPTVSHNVNVYDPFPHFTINQSSWTSSNGASGTGVLNYTIPEIQVGETVTFNVTMYIPENYPTNLNLVNRVYVSSDTPDPTPVTFVQHIDQIGPAYVTVTNNQFTLNQLVNDVLIDAECSMVSNITAQGFPAGVGYFHRNNATQFPIKEGIVLRSGPVLNTQGPFTNNFGDGTASGQGDTQLHQISLANGQSSSINDVTYIQFDFTPINDELSFDFLFASNEYGQYQCNYADVFAFILTDLTTNVSTNLAVIPGTTTPVSVINIRDCQYNTGSYNCINCPSQNIDYFDSYNGQGAPINMQGNTVKMTASSPVVPCRPYRIKLAIGDYMDSTLDSAVFLEAGSFNFGSVNLGDDYLVELGSALCPETEIELTSGLVEQEGCDNQYIYEWSNGETTPSIVVSEPGEYTLNVSMLLTSGGQTIECPLPSDTVVVEYLEEIPAGQPEDLKVCVNMYSQGPYTYDLTQNYDLIMQGLNAGDIDDLYYYTDLEEAINFGLALNWTDDVTNYLAEPGQTIYVRVQSFWTECYVIREFNLGTSNCLPMQPDPLVLCDVDGDGFENVNLNQSSLISQIYGSSTLPSNYSITFHETLQGANLETTEIIDATQPYSVPVTGEDLHTIYVRLQDNSQPETLFGIETYQVQVLVAPVVTALTPLELCDDNNDGFQTFNLALATQEITGGNTNYTVSYHLTIEDAQAGASAISSTNYTNISPNQQTLYVRVDVVGNTTISCPAITTLSLIVHSRPLLSTTVSSYSLCDSDMNGEEVFDLTTKSSEILNGEVYTLSFHTSLEDASNVLGGLNPIDTLESYTSSGETIWVRAENEEGCFSVTSFALVVNSLPPANTPEPLYACNDGLNTAEAPFLLYTRNTQITGGLPGLDVSYHATLADAEAGVGALTSPYTSGIATLYVRVENAETGCLNYTTLDLLIIDGPIANTPEPLTYCDTNNDCFGYFNLQDAVAGIIAGNTNPVEVSFHETIEDAQYNANALDATTPYANIDPCHQTIYVRVQSSVTECFATIALDLIVNHKPEIAEPTALEVCDDNYDGFAFFDLSSKAMEILNGLSPNAHTITYHPSEELAHQDAGAIAGIIFYENLVANQDVVWVRVEDNATGCYEVVALDLIVRPLPLVAMPNVTEYTLCDVDGDGFEEFDLESRIELITNNQTGLVVTFHDTYADAENSVNAYGNLHTNNEPFVETIFVRVENEFGCYVITLMDIRTAPQPVLTVPTTPVVYCDSDGDGYGVFDLSLLAEELLNGADAELYDINFYETYTNAEFGDNPMVGEDLTSYFNVNPFTQVIYVGVTHQETECRSIYPLTLEVVAAPVVIPTGMQALPNLEVCDDNTDGFSHFDFTAQTQLILANQTTAANHVVTYHISEQNAIDGTLAITQTTFYPNIETPVQTVWARVTNTVTGCYDIAPFDLIVNVPLELPTSLVMTECDDDEDGLVEFNLTLINNTVLQNADNPLDYVVSFHITQQNAIDGVAITNPENFSNGQLATPAPAVYTIWVKVTHVETGCVSYTRMTIRRAPAPNPLEDIVPQIMCDVNGDDDLVEEFDLTEQEDYIRNGDTNLIVTYHTTLEDAENNTNAIATPEAYVTGTTTIYIRVANVGSFSSGCAKILPLSIVVNPIPVMTTNLYAICETETTGFTAFDLAGFIPTLLGATQDPSDFLVEYYLTQTDAEGDLSPISLATPYTNIIPVSQTLWVSITNNATGCQRVAPLEIRVEEAARAVQPADLWACDYDGVNDGVETFDLLSLNAEVLDGQNPSVFLVSYHFTQEDAEAGVNAIANAGSYQNVDSPVEQTLYIRVVNSNTLTPCIDVTTVTLHVEILAEPVITAEDDIYILCVDYVTGNVNQTVTLNSNVSNDDYIFTWYHNGTVVPGATSSTYTVDYLGGEGEYYVVATSVSNLGCISEASEVFEVLLSGPATIVSIESTNAFQDQQDIIVEVAGYGDYMFQLDDGPLQPTGYFYNVTPGEHTVYVYDMTAGDVEILNSCTTTVAENIQTINYPTYFTPNGDGYHDVWNIIGLNYQPKAKIYIFDRHGKLLKQISPTLDGGWDGTYNGNPMPSSDYWFTVQYEEQGQIKEFKAHFSLKR